MLSLDRRNRAPQTQTIRDAWDADRSSGLFGKGDPGSAAITLAPNDDALDDCTGEHTFLALRGAFEASGGLGRGDELRAALSHSRPFANARPDKLPGRNSTFGFQWRSTFWVPMFQFGQDDLSIRPGPCRVRMELGEDFNGWEVCCWFAEPNSWLRERRPVDVLEFNLSAVLQAARADRFVVTG